MKKNKILYEVKPNSCRNDEIVKIKESAANEWCNKYGYKFVFITDEWFIKNIDKLEKVNYGDNARKCNANIKNFRKYKNDIR